MVLKIITSIYELNYEEKRGGGVYKSFPLLTQTIRNLIFNDYEYVIYTNNYTYTKYNLNEVFNFPNVGIKFCELNSEYYLNNVNTIRKERFDSGEIYERIYSVKNYVEVITNKIKFLLNENENGKNLVWIDSGLFGTSCSDTWRDYINEIAHSKLLLNKINEKISEYNFICLRGESIVINYELKNKLNNLFNTDFKLISGGIFGGNYETIKIVLSDYLEIFESTYKNLDILISEQEILSILTHKNSNYIKFFNFLDWNDFQRAILDLMGLLDINQYNLEKTYNVKI
jgi:hypothetical protein